jgi:poly-D-alanine transfer protein DltD
VQDLNWLLKTFGKTGTAVLFVLIGLIPIWAGIKKIRKNKVD